VRRTTPVTPGVEVAEVEEFLLARSNARHGLRDLPGDERFAAPWGLVVEQDAVGGEQAVRLAVVDRDPVGEQLGDAVRAARMKWRRLALWRRRAAEQL